jgi:hypothetical protein
MVELYLHPIHLNGMMLNEISVEETLPYTHNNIYRYWLKYSVLIFYLHDMHAMNTCGASHVYLSCQQENKRIDDNIFVFVTARGILNAKV